MAAAGGGGGGRPARGGPSTGTQRLSLEYRRLCDDPVEGIEAVPLETNIFEWHYVLVGPRDSPYEGGVYWGKLVFPTTYPFAPPSIFMFTPSGRFATDTRLCLSMSDFHPESWNPLWNVSSILKGLLSFMLEDQVTYGSVQTTEAAKRALAARSLGFCVSNPMFNELFPHYSAYYADLQAAARGPTAPPAAVRPVPVAAPEGARGGGAEVDRHPSSAAHFPPSAIELAVASEEADEGERLLPATGVQRDSDAAVVASPAAPQNALGALHNNARARQVALDGAAAGNDAAQLPGEERAGTGLLARVAGALREPRTRAMVLVVMIVAIFLLRELIVA